jgi:hypothetical protein
VKARPAVPGRRGAEGRAGLSSDTSIETDSRSSDSTSRPCRPVRRWSRAIGRLGEIRRAGPARDRQHRSVLHNNGAATLEEVVDHYIELFKRVQANFVPGSPIPPIVTTDGLNFDRRPTAAERAGLIAYLRKQ